MSLSVTASQANHYPYPLEVVLECDTLFCIGVARYSHEQGYVGAHSMAMADGWLERHTTKGRLWLCPRCSGK